MPSAFQLTVPEAERARVVAMLQLWDTRDPWDGGATTKIEELLLGLVYQLAAPRIPDVRRGEAAAKLLRAALDGGAA